MLQQSNCSDNRCGINCFAFDLIVKADIAADDRHIQHPAGLSHAGHRLTELPVDFRLLRVTKIKTVGDADRLCSDTTDVARCFSHRQHSPQIGVQVDIATVTINCHSQRLAAFPVPDYRCVATGSLNSAGTHHVIITAPDPLFGSNIG